MSAPQAKPPAGAAQAKPGHPPAAPPRDMFGGRMIGGLGMPTQKAKNFKGTLNRLLGYLRPHRGRLVVIVVAGAIGTVFSVLGPKILGMATTKIFEGFVAKARGVPGAAIDFDYVGRILLGLIALYIVGNSFQYLMQYLMANIAQLLTSALMLVGVIVMMLTISWILTLVIVLTLPLSIVIVAKVAKRSRPF